MQSAPLSPRPHSQGNPDASLFAYDAYAKRAAERRVDRRRDGSAGNARPPGVTIRAGEFAHTHRRNTDCRGRSRYRCAPAARSVGNCIADTYPRLDPCPACAALDNAADCGHKGRTRACFMPRECRRPGVSCQNPPGPSLIRRPDSRITAPSGTLGTHTRERPRASSRGQGSNGVTAQKRKTAR